MDQSPYRALEKKDLKGKKYTEIRLGKHRKRGFKDTSIFFDPNVFQLFHEVIWDKHREFSRSTTNSITVRDWTRIIDGFNEFIELIEQAKTKPDLKKALRLRSHMNIPELDNVDEFKQEIITMFEAFRDWIISHSTEEEYITICV